MTCSYIEGNVPKLIVHDIFRNIPRFYGDIKTRYLSGLDPLSFSVGCDYTLTNRPTMLHNSCEGEQVSISK